jgi:TolB protein
MRYLAAWIMVTTMCLLGCSGGGGGGGTDCDNTNRPASLEDTYPIDGVVDFADFRHIHEATVEIRDDDGYGAIVKTTTLRWAIIHDDRNIYFAFKWSDDTYDNDYDIDLGLQVFDGIKLLFDNDGDGVLENGEDERTVAAASIGSVYVDQHVTSGDETDRIGDGFGKLSYNQNSSIYQAEFLFPLTSDIEGEDAELSSQTRYNIIIFDEIDLNNDTGNIGSVYSLGGNTSTWPRLSLPATCPHDYPDIPSDLTGLITFISDHEISKGEIYTFDPATGRVTRVTNLPALFKDNVSLSHDGSQIAFHGSEHKNDTSTYEIYIMDIDGTNLTQLTNNNILDGHPGWSPDDARIAYASFRNGNRASIIIMQTDGTEISDLTPLGANDNDPDYLPDGRIIFKTGRFSVFPQVRIAVMNDDGSGVEQLTQVDETSDHDPVGNWTVTIFERFLKGTDFGTDVEAAFTPWDIVEAQLDGSDEQTLLSDGWVNWLPVYDPSGKYICYLKSSGYTTAYLMTRRGRHLGKLIPNITKIRYIDWK